MSLVAESASWCGSAVNQTITNRVVTGEKVAVTSPPPPTLGCVLCFVNPAGVEFVTAGTADSDDDPVHTSTVAPGIATSNLTLPTLLAEPGRR